jgi:hypothetical protein
VLTRALVSVLAAGLAAVLMLAAGQQAALAGGGPGGGNLVGSVTCGQSYSPQCEVTAGPGPPAVTPAGPGTQAGGQQAARTTAGGGAAGGCQGTVNKTFGCVPAGCQVTVQTLACPIGAAPAGAPAGAGAAPSAPAVLAALARQTLGWASCLTSTSNSGDRVAGCVSGRPCASPTCSSDFAAKMTAMLHSSWPHGRGTSAVTCENRLKGGPASCATTWRFCAVVGLLVQICTSPGQGGSCSRVGTGCSAAEPRSTCRRTWLIGGGHGRAGRCR